MRPKFIDFGLSKVFLEGEFSYERYGSLAYSSPEIIIGGKHNLSTDIWSLGIVLYGLLSGLLPFISLNKEMTKRNILL